MTEELDRTTQAGKVPIADGLFTWPSESPRLLGSRCRECGAVTFPQQPACPRCACESVEPLELARRGTLWTWTSQDFLPKSPPYSGPEDGPTFRPWFVGYVYLEEGLYVEGRLTGFDGRAPQIGEEVEVVVIPFNTDADGNEVMIYAFAPVGNGGPGHG